MSADGKKSRVYGVIMAGGGGTRFWPLSREACPKQLLNLSGKELMINETIDRITSVIPKKDIFIVTSKSQSDRMIEATKTRIKKENILTEPCKRNTAACIGYAAINIIKKHGDGIMCVFPADHYIKDEIAFASTVERAIEEVEKLNVLMTIGIKAVSPATGYGYIKYEKTSGQVANVEEFKEKPDYETAVRYVESGLYAWNSGMFVWRASEIIEKFREYLPDIYDELIKIGEAVGKENETELIEKIYPEIRSISVDYGIMEKADNVKVIPSEFGWSDVGSFENMDVLCESDENGNICYGENVSIESKNCVSYSKDGLIATVGVSGLIIVKTEDAVLVCDRNRAQEVKDIVDILKDRGGDRYL